jgi:hypothetical protein
VAAVGVSRRTSKHVGKQNKPLSLKNNGDSIPVYFKGSAFHNAGQHLFFKGPVCDKENVHCASMCKHVRKHKNMGRKIKHYYKKVFLICLLQV